MKRYLVIIIFLFSCFLAHAEDVPVSLLPDDLALDILIHSSIIITGDVIEGGGIPEESDKPISYAKVKITQILKGSSLPSIIDIKYIWIINEFEEYTPIKPKKKYLFFLEKEEDHYILAFPERRGCMGASGPYEISKEYEFLSGLGKGSKWEKLTTEEVIKIIKHKLENKQN